MVELCEKRVRGDPMLYGRCDRERSAGERRTEKRLKTHRNWSQKIPSLSRSSTSSRSFSAADRRRNPPLTSNHDVLALELRMCVLHRCTRAH
ncbi:hypothetical protein NL676_029825 [Syzygium grande]|nr:hypothetical protein NL676_029825 [Syzygium grande]